MSTRVTDFGVKNVMSVSARNHQPDIHILDFGLPANDGNTNVTMTGTESMSPRPQAVKILACARCHSQKLRCVRRIADGRTCDRCQSAGVECVERKPQRMGRPIELGVSKSQARNGHQKSARRDGSPVRKQARQDLGLGYGTELGGADFSMANGPPSTLSPVDSDSSASRAQQGIMTGVSELEEWSWPVSSAQGGQPYLSPPHTNGNLGGEEGSLSAPNRAGNPPDNRFTYGQPMLMSIADINEMLLNFGDGLDSALQLSTSVSGQSSSPENGGPDTDSSLDDPIEQLSKLHLELYQCLNVVKAVEKQKKEFMQSIAGKNCGKIDTTWSERLFAMTEKFIAALERYANSAAASTTNGTSTRESSTETDISSDETSLSNDNSLRVGQQKDRMVHESISCDQEVDPATGLMIVSCVTRLLQIFESLVFIVEAMKEASCPASYVQIRLGAFVPSMSKALHARLLGQYILHLLEIISEMATRTVPSRQLYARAVADNRSVESKLRERLIASIQS